MAVSGLLVVNTKASDLKKQPKIKEVEKAEIKGTKAVNKGKILARSLASFGFALATTAVSSNQNTFLQSIYK